MSSTEIIPLRFKMKLLRYIYLLAIFISSCNGNSEKHPDKIFTSEEEVIIRAERLSLLKFAGYTKVTIIDPWQGANNVKQVYYLFDRGSVLPASIDSSQVIFIPLKNIICMSTTHIAMIEALGEEKTITGVSGTGLIYSDVVNANASKGLIKDVGYEANLNKEMILKISPDLIMMYGIGAESAGYVGKIMEMGINVIFNADYLEKDPLSKAEWIKLFGALYCKERIADSIYNSAVNEYIRMKSYIEQNINNRPKVLLGLPFKDTWYISPGNSFMSKLISDAGGEYLWQNTESSISMPLGIENVYLLALTADYWLNIGTVKSKDEISMIDQRLKDLPCFINGKLYNNNNRVTITGGNDYWECVSIYPNTILEDIASILHPDLFPDKELFFYRKIY
jgi:iron complex transport system substrate-binding protein